jgi:hypothetical protein
MTDRGGLEIDRPAGRRVQANLIAQDLMALRSQAKTCVQTGVFGREGAGGRQQRQGN